MASGCNQGIQTSKEPFAFDDRLPYNPRPDGTVDEFKLNEFLRVLRVLRVKKLSVFNTEDAKDAEKMTLVTVPYLKKLSSQLSAD